MRSRWAGMWLIVLVLVLAPASPRAQQDPPAPAPATTKEPVCDAVCELGRALNQKDTPIQSQSGTGRGIVTKIPVDKQLDFRPPNSNFDSRIETK
jgi:hypothetical protein